MTKVMRKEARHTQRRDQASGVPLKILEHLPPKPESAYFLLCAFTYISDFTGGGPPLPLSEKRVSLQLSQVHTGEVSRISGWTPEARSRICVCRASFLMTFVQSGML